jgi:hypothetical protein
VKGPTKKQRNKETKKQKMAAAEGAIRLAQLFATH